MRRRTMGMRKNAERMKNSNRPGMAMAMASRGREDM
jgi:hypothetical protein